MNRTSEHMDMLHGPLIRKILLFAAPIALSGMMQQLFNAADTAVVGHFADAGALAAVGTNGEFIGLLISLSAGLAIGANVLAASLIGAGKKDRISAVLHTSVLLSLIIGVAGAVIGQFISKPLLEMMATPAAILAPASAYLRIYFIGYPFLLLYDFASALLRAKGDSRTPFYALILAGIVNVLLNLFFVIVCHMAVTGVALATAISTGISGLLVILKLWKSEDEFHFSPALLRLGRSETGKLMYIGIPAAVQGAVFCLANLFIQASVNSFGPAVIAGSSIAMNFEYFGYYIITAFGQTATTFTSQNFYAGKHDRCRRILWLCMAASVFFAALLVIPVSLFRPAFSRLFSADPEVIAASVVRLRWSFTLELICGLFEVPAGCMRGSGHSALPAALTVISTCALRIIWIYTIFAQNKTPATLYLVFPVSWIVTILVMGIAYVYVLRKNAGQA
jgi:putative MATE family efflux protein